MKTLISSLDSPLPLLPPEAGCGSGLFAAQHRGWLLAQTLRWCRDRQEAEDIVQEALLRFLQTFPEDAGLPHPGACEAWLRTTAMRLFYDQCRRRQLQARWVEEAGWSGTGAATEPPGAWPVYDTLTDAQLGEAIHALSPKLRTTFELHAAGQKYQDIAQALGLSLGTVSKRLYDARAKLHKLLLPHVCQA
ncbi:RNA polymerase sigma-70 factor, ECF subfamily [Stigmatella aurantiaca]|uniref:RNA polymerase sigma-70 factor, ECF subfamily n=1 Tax=Stigmatella aurantiaca TaxID=41 RepID=A0A1H7HZ74_STIAU|nr:RNA polymerase sigma factor [Stigmatella aurantiaca]SEK55596.1 RNA polymerase sigma-70 factor, ECF subfamily [Stigmatella aurantiaca]